MTGGADTRTGGLARSDIALWSLSFLIVVALHGAGAWAVLANWDQGEAGAPAAIAIEMAPMAAAPSSEPQPAPPTPEQEQATPVRESEGKPDEQLQAEQLKPVEPEIESPKVANEPVENPEPVREVAAETSEQLQPVQMAEVKIDQPPPDLTPVQDLVAVPDLLPAPNPEVAIALPPPPRTEKAEEKKEVEKKPPPPKKKPPPRAAKEMAPQAARNNAARATASNPVEGNRSAEPAWRAQMNAHVKRHVRYPSGTQSQGSAVVAFTLDRSGRVMSARLARSSGTSLFDQEAVSAIRRASPVPAPPASIGALSFTMPVQFTLPR